MLTHTARTAVIDQMRSQQKLFFGGIDFEDPIVTILDHPEPGLTAAKGWYIGYFHEDFARGKFRCLAKDLLLLHGQGDHAISSERRFGGAGLLVS